MKTRTFLIPLTVGLGPSLTLILLLTAGARTSASAPVAELHVCTGCTYQTIQAAVDAAGDGDTIKVARGTYTASGSEVVSITKDITLTGGYLPPNWGTSDPGANPTILDGQDARRGIYVAPNYAVTVDGLQIVRGSGGGVYIAPYGINSHVTIRNCDILSNTTGSNGGGGVYIRNGSLLLQNSHVISNTAGGSGSGGGIYARDAVVTITNNTIHDNVAYRGGGVWIYQCTAYLAGNTLDGNRSGWGGGGLQSNWGNVILTGNTFSDNQANGQGGGIAVGGVGPGNVYTITHNLIQENVACPDGTGTGGGAYVANSGWVEFSHNQVISNTASQSGRGAGGGIYISGPARVSGNLIQGNRASTGSGSAWGGGVAVDFDVWMDGNRILDNWATVAYVGWDAQGGGVAISVQDRVTMTNNIIAGNHYANRSGWEVDDGGGAIYIGGQTRPAETWVVLNHNTIADNQSPAILNESAGVTMSHSIFYSQTTDIETMFDSSGAGSSELPSTVLDYTLWWPAQSLQKLGSTVITTTNDFTADPRFITLGLDDYHLGPGSPPIDLGPGVGVTSDIDGNRRPVLNGYDLGADEALFVFVPLVLRAY